MRKQVLYILLAMGSWIAGCGGGNGTETESVVVNDYTNWASLLQNSPVEESSIALQDGRTIIGYRENPTNFQDKIKTIVTLSSSYSSNLEEFKVDINQEKNAYIVTLNENVEDKPKVALYLGVIKGHNKEELQNQVKPISFIKSGENPLNIPVEVVQTSKNEYWLEFSLINSGTYSFAFNAPTHSSSPRYTPTFREMYGQSAAQLASRGIAIGPSSTMFTGPDGIDPSTLKLGKHRLQALH